ncbi:MAG: CinA family protein [Nocardioidaceae bacterium]
MDALERHADQQVLGATLHAELLRRSMTLATAESLTGGALADLCSASPGASETYPGGVVSYATEVKTGLLRVAERTVAEHGVISDECAREMALGVRAVLGTDWGLATTGVAGPTTQEGKPVGEVHLAVAGPDAVVCRRLDLGGDRASIREQAVVEAARLALEAVTGHAAPERHRPAGAGS